MGAVTVLVVDHRRVHRLQRERRPAVRAHLRREGRDPDRQQAREGQRGPRRRLPRRRGRRDHAEGRGGGRRAQVGRGDRDEARQDGRAARHRHHASRCGRARRSASSTWSSPPARPRRPTRRATRCRSRNASEGLELEDVFSTLDETRATTPALRSRASATPSPRAAQSLNTAIQALNPLFTSLQPVMTEPERPGHPARPVLPPARPHLRAGGAGRQRPGRPVQQHGRHLRGDRQRPGARCRRRSRSRRPRSTPRSARSASSGPSWPTSPTSRGGCARPSTSCRARCRPINRAFRVGTPILPRTVALNERLRRRAGRARGPVREPQHAAHDPRPAHHVRRHAAGARVHRALPDGLQLLQLLLPPARRAPVAGHGDGRHGPDPGREDRRTTSSRTPTATSRRRGRGTCRRASTRSGPRRRAWRSAASTRTPYQPAIDAQGNADCQNGQVGFVRGPLAPGRALRAGRAAGRHADRRQRARADQQLPDPLRRHLQVA